MKISDISLFRAFRSSNYTLYFIGRSFSQLGTWMQRTAVVWVVYTITHSVFMVGITIFAEQFPLFLLSALGGMVADRYNRYTIIKITQVVSTIQASLLAVLVITGHYVVWEILGLSVILGIINSFDIPARQAMIHEVLDDATDLPNALSLNSAMASLARLLGPALSGVILAKFGAGVCFSLNAISFGGVILSLFFMKLPVYVPQQAKKRVISELVDGFLYLKQIPAISLIILVLAIECLLVIPYNTLLPVFAKVIFKGNAATYGYITSFIGVGAVAGSILITSLKRGANLRLFLVIAMVVLGIGQIAFSRTNNFALAMLFATLCGLGTIAQNTISNIIIQSESTPNMRGRVIGIMLMAMFGMIPLGSLLVGAVSEKIGAPNTLLFQGIIGLIIAVIFFQVLKKEKFENKS